MRTRQSIDRSEVPSDEHLAIRLQRQRENAPVRSCAGIETEVQIAIRVEPGNSVSVRAIPNCLRGQAVEMLHYQPKGKKEMNSDRVRNPHDPEATYATKGQGEQRKEH